MSSIDWNKLIQEFGNKIGLEHCNLDSGLCTILLEDDLRIELERSRSSDHLMVYVPLSGVSRGKDNTALELLNFFFDHRVNAPASVCYDRHQEEFLLCTTLGSEISHVDQFDVTLQSIVEFAQHWNNRSNSLPSKLSMGLMDNIPFDKA